MNTNSHNPMQEQYRQDLERKTRMLKAEFAAVDDVNIRTIPEPIFIRDFLPLFSGQRPENAQDLLDAWRLIAGTPFIPVNIVDAAGRKIIQVPPLLDAMQINPAALKQKNLTTMGAKVEDADSMRHLSPHAADGLIVKALAERTKMLQAPKELSPEWQALLTHYKHLLPNQGADAGVASAKDDGPGESLFEM